MDIPLDLKLFMNNPTQKVYKCDQCNASYSDKSYFDLHKQTHQKTGGGGGGSSGGSGGASGNGGGGGGAGVADDGGSNGEGGSGGEELPATVQIVMPAPAHQQEQQQQVLQQEQQQQQLTAYKRAYGGEVHQIYEIAPSTRYQVVTSGTPHVLTAVTLASLPGQVTGQVTTLPSYTTTPTYVLAEQPLPQGVTAVTAAAPGQRTATVATLHQDHHHQHQDHQHQQQQVTVQQQQQQQQATIQQVTVQQQQPQQQATVQHHSQPQQQQQQQQQQQRLVIALEPKERPYKCDQCTASFIDPGELTEHKKKHSGDGPFTCEDCHFTFMYKSHFRSHKTRCLKKRALMPHPPKPIINPGPIKRQFPTHHNKTHNQHHHNQHQQHQQQQQQQHQQQQQATATPAAQHHHHAAANNTRSGGRAGGQHNNRQSGGSGGGGGGGGGAANTASFNPNNPSFKRQRKEQRLDRPYECTECDASFQTAQDLQGHKAKHTGEGPFKCDECRFVFLYRKLYEAHRRRCEKKRKDPQQQQQQHQQQQQQQQLVQAQSQALQQQQQQVSVSAAGAGQAQVVQTASGQQVQIHGGRATLSAAPTTVQLSGPIQIQAVPGHPQAAAVIDMRSLQQQGGQAGQGGQGGQGSQAVQHLQHPTLIEQVIHVTPVPSGSLGGGRQEIKYDLVPATVDVADVNQIMNLIKVKGHPQ